jgi:hypothetical protein
MTPRFPVKSPRAAMAWIWPNGSTRFCSGMGRSVWRQRDAIAGRARLSFRKLRARPLHFGHSAGILSMRCPSRLALARVQA